MDTGYTLDINNCEVTYASPLEDGFTPLEEEA